MFVQLSEFANTYRFRDPVTTFCFVKKKNQFKIWKYLRQCNILILLSLTKSCIKSNLTSKKVKTVKPDLKIHDTSYRRNFETKLC